jgi:hypothetical protein
VGFAGNCLRSEGYDDNSIVYAAVVSSRLTDGEYYSRENMPVGRTAFTSMPGRVIGTINWPQPTYALNPATNSWFKAQGSFAKIPKGGEHAH